MDKDGPQQMKRPPPAASATGRPSFARSRGVRPSHGNTNRHHLPSSAGAGDGGAVSGDTDLMDDDGWKQEKLKGARGGSTSGDGEIEMGLGGGEDDVIRPPPAAAITTDNNSKKRVKLNGKVADDCVPVDPVLVPRKLRSAIHKRGNESAACPPPAFLKRLHRVLGGTSGVKRSKQSMVMADPLTKDEEEVIEALSALASIVTECKPIVDGRLVAENVVDDDTKETASKATISKIHPEGTNPADAKFTSTSVGGESITTVHSHRRCMESSEKAQVCNALTRDDDAIERPKTIHRSGIPDIDLGLSNNVAEEEVQERCLSSMNNGECSSQPNSGGTNISYRAGNLLHAFPSNGKFQVTQLQCRLPPEPGIVGLLPNTSAVPRQKNKTSKEGSYHLATREEAASNRWNMPASTSIHGNFLTETTSARPDSASCCVGRSDPSASELSAEKGLMDAAAAHGKGSWKKCATHVHISRMIQRYQDTERKQDGHHQLKLSDGKESVGSSLGRDGGVTSHKELLLLHDGRMKHPTTSGPCSQPTLDFMSPEPGNKSKWLSSSSSGYPQPFSLHHHMMMMAFPPHPEQLSSPQQQLQLPACYIGHNPIGRPSRPHQQHMWQPHHLGNGRPSSLVGFPVPPPPSSSTGNPQVATTGPSAQHVLQAHQQQITHHNHPGMCNDGRLQLLL